MNLVTVQQENIQQVTTNTESLALDQVEEEFRDVFKGKGYLEGKLHLEIDKTVTPVINPPRRVLFLLKDKLKSELDRLEGLQMIHKKKRAYQMDVKSSSDWKAQWKIESLHWPGLPESDTNHEAVQLSITCDRRYSSWSSRC